MRLRRKDNANDDTKKNQIEKIYTHPRPIRLAVALSRMEAVFQNVGNILRRRAVKDHAKAALAVQVLDGLVEFLVHDIVWVLNVWIEVNGGIVEAHVGHEGQQFRAGAFELAVAQNFGHVSLGKALILRRHQAAHDVAASSVMGVCLVGGGGGRRGGGGSCAGRSHGVWE